jgi:hypothetical protein
MTTTLSTTDYINAWDSLFAIVLPFIVALAVKRSWPGYVKGFVGLGLALVFALVRTYLEGKLDMTNVAQSFFYVSALAELTYQKVGKEFAKYLQENYGNTDPATEPVTTSS